MERAMSNAIKTSIDTSRTIVVAGSTAGTRWKLVRSTIGILVGSGLVALLVSLLWTAAPGPAADGFLYYCLVGLGYFLVFFFGLMVLACIGTIFECRKYLKMSADILTISPDGIRDRRVMEEFLPWQAVKAVRTADHEPDFYLGDGTPGKVTPIRRTPMDVVLDVDPALTSEALKQQVLIAGFARMAGMRTPVQDTRPWITFTIDLWRLKNITAGALYDTCEAYLVAARAKQERRRA